MTDLTPRDLDALAAGPDDLDGHTIEELADYVDAGRTPPDPAIEDSPACRRAIAALERLRAVSADLLTDPPARDSDDAWVESVMRRISSDVRAGADVLLEETPDGHRIVITEGALRGLVRSAADSVPGVLAGRVRLAGDFTADGATAHVALDLVVVHGVVIGAAADAVRAAVVALLRRHTDARTMLVDITVTDLITGSSPA